MSLHCVSHIWRKMFFCFLCSLHDLFFFFNDTATTEIYTLSLHDALPISLVDPGAGDACPHAGRAGRQGAGLPARAVGRRDRKSTRLNSSHSQISYAVFCLKKKKQTSHSLVQIHVRRESVSTSTTRSQART